MQVEDGDIIAIDVLSQSIDVRVPLVRRRQRHRSQPPGACSLLLSCLLVCLFARLVALASRACLAGSPPNHHPLLTAFLSHTYTPCTCVSLFCFPLSGGDEDAIRKLEAADPPAHAGSHNAEQVLPVRKAPSFEPFYAHRMIILPRQARDNHRKS